MKATKFFTVVAALAATVGTGVYYSVPNVRTLAHQQWRSWTGWTAEAREADPVGFVGHAAQRLSEDLADLKKTRRDFGQELGNIGRHQRELEALLSHADGMAAEFRGAYQRAVENDSFPVTVRGGAYTKEQVESQVSMLLAEADGYRAAVDKLVQVQKQAGEKLESLTVRIDSTEAQLAMLGTQRELLRARVIGDEGDRLAAAVDELMNGNREVLADNPVRRVPELLAAKPAEDHQPNIVAARQYLGAARRVEEFPSVAARVDDTTVSPQQYDKPAKAKCRQVSRKAIFEQS